LNPVIGYAQGAQLVKESLSRNISIRELIMEKTKTGTLKHRDDDHPVTMDEIEEVLGNLRRLTEGGIV
jgi:aspartate ammonia-lyase